jgi:hypothetical protein
VAATGQLIGGGAVGAPRPRPAGWLRSSGLLSLLSLLRRNRRGAGGDKSDRKKPMEPIHGETVYTPLRPMFAASGFSRTSG